MQIKVNLLLNIAGYMAELKASQIIIKVVKGRLLSAISKFLMWNH